VIFTAGSPPFAERTPATKLWRRVYLAIWRRPDRIGTRFAAATSNCPTTEFCAWQG
jgi:hypothetical protein